jgi:hypothetical protein
VPHSRGPVPGMVVDTRLVRPGLRVQRGPDWRWGNQDGGLGSIGVVQGEERHGWATVRWPSGTENGYRVGDSGKFDLQVAGKHGTGNPQHHRVYNNRHPSVGLKQPQAQTLPMAGRVGCAARARTRCWCIDQYGDVLHLP